MCFGHVETTKLTYVLTSICISGEYMCWESPQKNVTNAYFTTLYTVTKVFGSSDSPRLFILLANLQLFI